MALSPESASVYLSPESMSVDEEERQADILRRHGIPSEVGAVLLRQSEEGYMSGLRGNDSAKIPMRRYGLPAAPKPSSVKAKTGNWGPINGVIAVDNKKPQRLGKVESNKDGELSIRQFLPHDYPDNQPTITHRISLAEVIDGVKSNEYSINFNDGALEFKIHESDKDVPASAKGLTFRLALPPLDEVPPPSETEPDWWDENRFGDYEDKENPWRIYSSVVEDNLDLQLKNDATGEFEDIKVLACNDADGNPIPITGDIDHLMNGVAVDDDHALLQYLHQECPSAFEPINTFTSGGTAQLIKSRIELEMAIYKFNNKTDMPDDELAALYERLNNEDLLPGNQADAKHHYGKFGRVGCITPLESYFMDEGNKKISEALFDGETHHTRDVFQHGAEVHNPGEPNPIGKCVFFINGKVEEADGPEEVAELLLKAQPPVKVDIHPKWDMKCFGKVVQQQLDNGMRVAPATLDAYCHHLSKTENADKAQIQAVRDQAKENESSTKNATKPTKDPVETRASTTRATRENEFARANPHRSEGGYDVARASANAARLQEKQEQLEIAKRGTNPDNEKESDNKLKLG